MGLTYFFDTYAAFALVEGKPSYARYTEHVITFTIFNLVELYFLILRDFGEKKAQQTHHAFKECLIEISDEVIAEAMVFRLANKRKNLSYADCIGYICAKKKGLTFLTGDKEFQNLDNVEFVQY